MYCHSVGENNTEIILYIRRKTRKQNRDILILNMCAG